MEIVCGATGLSDVGRAMPCSQETFLAMCLLQIPSIKLASCGVHLGAACLKVDFCIGKIMNEAGDQWGL